MASIKSECGAKAYRIENRAMNSSEILAQIEEEIDRLQAVKALLSGSSSHRTLKTSPQSKPSKKTVFKSTRAGKFVVHAEKKQPWSKAKKSGRRGIKGIGTEDGGYGFQRGD
jgi:hypothetical protein